MRAYHIRTNESDPHDVMLGFERFNLDSIYVPEKHVLCGFAYYNLNTRSGQLLDYSDYPGYDRAQKIVNGNNEGIRGDVISTTNIKSEIVDEMITFCKKYNGTGIKLKENFDGSTSSLIEIVSGSLKDTLKDKVKRIFQR